MVAYKMLYTILNYKYYTVNILLSVVGPLAGSAALHKAHHFAQGAPLCAIRTFFLTGYALDSNFTFNSLFIAGNILLLH